MAGLNVRAPVWVKNTAIADANKDDLWIPTVVEGKHPEGDSYNIRVKINSKDKTIKLARGQTENDEIKMRNPVPTPELENILDLPYLNEAEILFHLRERFYKGDTFTLRGSVLVSINPFEDITTSNESKELLNNFVYDIFTNSGEFTPRAVSTKSTTTDPGESDKVTSEKTSVDTSGAVKHTIIISGESGSGKSVCFNTILNLLAESKQDETKNEVIYQLSSCNTLLECFGNAKTVHTSNSSRFGKLMRFRMANQSLTVLSCSIQAYLLEQSRICRQSKQERNFNVFYQMVCGINSMELNEERKKFHILPDVNQYFYLTQGGILTGTEIEIYASKYSSFLEAIEKLGLHHYLSDEIQHILSAILLLGNIIFEDKGSSGLSSTSTDASIKEDNDRYYGQITELLGLEHKDNLIKLLTKKHITTRGESFESDLTAIQSAVGRDAIVKLMYRCVFLFLVEEMNTKLELFMAHQESTLTEERSSKGHYQMVQILDIFGFDAFEKNSIDQMCINYANEELHRQFNSHIFQTEMELYEHENINYDRIEYADNTENCELIGNGIFRILDDQCRIPHPTDKRFIAQLYKEYDLHPLFSVSELQHGQDKFTIKHFAGNVEYQADDFVSKNLDYTPLDTATILAQAKNSILAAQLGAAVHTSEITVKRRGSTVSGPKTNENMLAQLFTKKKISFGTSLVTDFKNQLAALLKEIETTHPHYIKCIKSYEGETTAKAKTALLNDANTTNRASVKLKRFSMFVPEVNRWSHAHVAQQLRSNGILESVRIALTGYQCRMTYSDFYARYRFVASEIDPNLKIPMSLPSHLSEVQVKLVCNQLCDTLAMGRDDQPKQLSPGSKQSASGRRFSFKREQSFARTRSTNNLSMRDLKVDSFSLSEGIIDRRNVQFGETKIFFKLQEYTFLEAFRNKCLKEYVKKIQKVILGYVYYERYRKYRIATQWIQRVYRGHVARRRVRGMKLLLVSVVRIQRQFRRKRYFKASACIQTCMRGYLARRRLEYLKELKERLAKTYGQFIIAREMRLQRRSKQRQRDNNAKESLVIAATTPSYRLPAVEKRTALTNEQYTFIQDKLISSNILSDGNNSFPVAPSPAKIPMKETATSTTSTSNHATKKDMKPKIKVGDVSISPMTAQQASIIDTIEQTMNNLPVNAVPYADLLSSWNRQLSLLSDNISNRPIKIKVMKYKRYLLPSEQLMDTKMLIDHSMIGKIFGFSIWKNMQTLSVLQIPEHQITSTHGLFRKIMKMITRLKSLSQVIENIMEAAKQNLLVRIQYETNPADVQVIFEIKQLCKEFIHYYEEYIHYFVTEFGENSSFYYAFHSSQQQSSRDREANGKSSTARKEHIKYLIALMDIIDSEKKYTHYSRQMSQSRGTGLSSIAASTNIGGNKAKLLNVFTLAVDWQDMMHQLPAHHPLSPQNPNRQKNKEAFSQLLIKDSDTLRKLAEVSEGKAELNLQNLRVVSYSGLQFQYMPSEPGIEYAMNAFRDLFAGTLSPRKKILKVTGNRHLIGKSAYYSVYSEEGLVTSMETSAIAKKGKTPYNHDFIHHTLMDVLYDPIAVEQVHTRSFSASVLSCCLLGLLHLQPNHVSVHIEKNPANHVPLLTKKELPEKTFSMSNDSSDSTSLASMDQNIRITAFESDPIVTSGFLDFNNTYRLKVHEHNLNVLFVLPQMDEPIDDEVKNLMISSPFIAEELMIHWLRDLHDQNQRYRSLVNAFAVANLSKDKGSNALAISPNTAVNSTTPTSVVDLTETDLKELHLPIQFAKGAVKEIMRRLTHIISFMTDHSQDREAITNSKVLREFFPHLSDYYDEIRHTSDFTEGVEFGGVVSYAYAYHAALKEVKEWSQKLADSGTNLALENMTDQTSDSGSNHPTSAVAANAPSGGFFSDLFQKKAAASRPTEDALSPTKSESSEYWRDIPVVSSGSRDQISSPNKFETNPLRLKKLASASQSQQKIRFNVNSSSSDARLEAVDELRLGDIYEERSDSVRFPLSEKYGSPLKRKTGNGDVDVNYSSVYSAQSTFSKYSILSAGSMNSNQNVLTQQAVRQAAKTREQDSFDYDDVFTTKDTEAIVNSFSFEDMSVKKHSTSPVPAMSPSPITSSRKKMVSFSTMRSPDETSKSGEKVRTSITDDSSVPGTPEVSPTPKRRNSSANKLQDRVNAARLRTAMYGSNKSLTTNFDDELKEEPGVDEADKSLTSARSNLDEIAAQMKRRREAFQTTDQYKPLQSRKKGHAAAVTGPNGESVKKFKRRQTFIQVDDVKTMNGKNANTKAVFSQPEVATKEFTKRLAPLDTPIEVEAMDFLRSLDFRTIRERSLDFQQVLTKKEMKESFTMTEEGKAGSTSSDFSSRLCRSIGKNLTFLSSLPLQNINEQQLRMMFRYYLRAKQLLQQHSFVTGNHSHSPLQKLFAGDNQQSKPTSHETNNTDGVVGQLKQRIATLQTKTLLLSFDSREELDVLRKSYILYQLKKELQLDIKLIFLKKIAAEKAKAKAGVVMRDSPTSLKIDTLSAEGTPDTVKNTDSNESVPQNAANSRSSVVYSYQGEEEEIIDYTIQYIMNSTNSTTPQALKQYFSTAAASDYSIASDAFDDEMILNDPYSLQKTPVVNEELRKELLSMVMKTSNLFAMSSTAPSTTARNEVKLKVDQLKMIINHLSTEPVDIDGLESSLCYSLLQMLLEYPSLSPIALLLAKHGGFKKNLLFIHQLIQHKYMDRFIDLIYEIIIRHPEVLIMVDSEGYLPCDRLKAIPDYYHAYMSSGLGGLGPNSRSSVNTTTSSQSQLTMETLHLFIPPNAGHANLVNAPSPQKVLAKYTLLAKIVNFAGDKAYRYLQSMTRGGLGVGLFSHYRGEEELIILATHYDFPAMEEEFIQGYYDLNKLDTKRGVTLLTKLIYKEVSSQYRPNQDVEQRQQLSYLYHLLQRSLQNRIMQRVMTKEEVTTWIRDSVAKDRLHRLFSKKREEGDEGDSPRTGFSETKCRSSLIVEGSGGPPQGSENQELELSMIYQNIREVWSC